MQPGSLSGKVRFGLSRDPAVPTRGSGSWLPRSRAPKRDVCVPSPGTRCARIASTAVLTHDDALAAETRQKTSGQGNGRLLVETGEVDGRARGFDQRRQLRPRNGDPCQSVPPVPPASGPAAPAPPPSPPAFVPPADVPPVAPADVPPKPAASGDPSTPPSPSASTGGSAESASELRHQHWGNATIRIASECVHNMTPTGARLPRVMTHCEHLREEYMRESSSVFARSMHRAR